jgi:hypothetical protein
LDALAEVQLAQGARDVHPAGLLKKSRPGARAVRAAGVRARPAGSPSTSAVGLT